MATQNRVKDSAGKVKQNPASTGQVTDVTDDAQRVADAQNPDFQSAESEPGPIAQGDGDPGTESAPEIIKSNFTSASDPAPIDRAALGALLRTGMRACQMHRTRAPELNQFVKDMAAFVQHNGL